MPKAPNEKDPEERLKQSPDGENDLARQEIARQIMVEKDVVKLGALWRKLDQLMLAQERENVRRRLRRSV